MAAGFEEALWGGESGLRDYCAGVYRGYRYAVDSVCGSGDEWEGSGKRVVDRSSVRRGTEAKNWSRVPDSRFRGRSADRCRERNCGTAQDPGCRSLVADEWVAARSFRQKPNSGSSPLNPTKLRGIT